MVVNGAAVCADGDFLCETPGIQLDGREFESKPRLRGLFDGVL